MSWNNLGEQDETVCLGNFVQQSQIGTVPAKYFEKFKCEKSGAYLAEIPLCENAAEVKFSECEKFFLKNLCSGLFLQRLLHNARFYFISV